MLVASGGKISEGVYKKICDPIFEQENSPTSEQESCLSQLICIIQRNSVFQYVYTRLQWKLVYDIKTTNIYFQESGFFFEE